MPNAALFVSPGPLVDGSGNPYAFAKLNFYITGTSSRLNTYSDSGLTSANTNPVVADINGKFGPIYLSANTSYKVVFATSADVTIWTWDPVQGISIGVTPSVGLLRSYLSGLTLSRNVGTPNTKIDVAAGACADSTNVLAMSVLAGTVDCSTVGLNGLDAGALANATWYHFFAIAKVDGTIGLLASTSASSPVLPSGYTLFRRLGFVKTDASAHFLAFTQIGDTFYKTVPPADYASVSVTSTQTLTLNLPTGLAIEAIFHGTMLQNSGSAVSWAADLVTPGQTTLLGSTWAGFGTQAGAIARVHTNTSAQVKLDLSALSGTFQLSGAVYGWVDRRGRDD